MSYIILLIVPSVLCQFEIQMGMRPDMSFGESNDRFDVRAMFPEEKALGSEEISRRSFIPERIRKGMKEVNRRIKALRMDKYNKKLNSKFMELLNNMENNRKREQDITYVNPAVLREKEQDDMSLVELLRRDSGFNNPRMREVMMQTGRGKRNRGRKVRLAKKAERELNLLLAVPVKIKVLDMEKGSLITEVNLL